MADLVPRNPVEPVARNDNAVPNLGHQGIRATHLVRGESGMQVTQYEIPAGEPFGGEWEWDQVWMVHAGEGQMSQSGPDEWVAPYRPGSMFVFPAGVRHLVQTTTDSLFMLFEGHDLKTTGPWREWQPPKRVLTEWG